MSRIQALIVFCALAFARILFRQHKERTGGRHRQAQKNPRNPRNRTRARHFPGAPGSIGAAFAQALATGPRLETPDLERVQSDMPILAHRQARLHLGAPHGRPFGSMFHQVRFGADSEAECLNLAGMLEGNEHQAPHPGCSCGFYALPSDVDRFYSASVAVTLLVELSGVVVEHERGFRAQHQRVVECQVVPCEHCGERAELLVVVGSGQHVTNVRCANHAPFAGGVTLVNATELEQLLDVPVTFQVSAA